MSQCRYEGVDVSIPGKLQGQGVTTDRGRTVRDHRICLGGSRNISIHVRKVAMRDRFVAKLRPSCGNFWRFGLTLGPAHEGQSFEKMNVLLVFQQGTMEARQGRPALAPQVFGRQIFGQQQAEPIEHFGG